MGVAILAIVVIVGSLGGGEAIALIAVALLAAAVGIAVARHRGGFD